MNTIFKTNFRVLALTAIISILHACGSGSGASTSENPITATPDVSNYTGPAPATTDVQAFRINVWDNLVPNNRCGACHNETQNPRFVRADDVNLAYDIANTVVNLTDPGDSRLVTKVLEGHNCWLTSDAACGDIIESYIQNWAGDSIGGDGKTVNLEAPPIQDPGSSKNFPASTADFVPVHDPVGTLLLKLSL